LEVATGIVTERPKSHLLTATGKVRLNPIVIKDSYIRISAKGTGTVTSSSLAINAIIGN